MGVITLGLKDKGEVYELSDELLVWVCGVDSVLFNKLGTESVVFDIDNWCDVDEAIEDMEESNIAEIEVCDLYNNIADNDKIVDLSETTSGGGVFEVDDEGHVNYITPSYGNLKFNR